MPTFAEIKRNLRSYKRAMSDLSSPPAQLAWFCRQLGVGKPHLLRLLGYSPTEVTAGRLKGVKELAEARPEQTLWVTELFKELANRAGYDMRHLRNVLHTRPGEPAEPDRVTRPAGVVSHLRYTPYERPGVLLDEIARGGPQVFDRFAEYLRSDAEG